MSEVVLGVVASLLAAPLLWAGRVTFERLRARRRRAALPAGSGEPVPTADAWGEDHSTCLDVPSTFVGRAAEVGEVAELVSRARLVTLTGPGGSGKTRLAQEVRASLRDRFADGTRCVDLTALSAPSRVVPTVAYVVGVRDSAGRDGGTEALVKALRTRRLLLVLDNCEHVLEAAAPLASRLLGTCPHLHVLATSREPLGVAGEERWPVRPLSLPDEEDGSSLPRLLERESVQLFVERATAANREFRLTEENAPTVVEICRKLDGMPLAIELAAPLTSTMHLRDVADALDAEFDRLPGGVLSAEARQQTLAHTMEWSFRLLSELQQRLWTYVSVFAGVFDRDTALALASALVPDVTDRDLRAALDGLVNKSVLQLMPEGEGPTTYRLLQTVRTYGQRVAEGRGEWRRARAAHARLFLARSEELEPRLTSGERPRLWATLERMYPDFLAALAWSAEEEGDRALGLALAGNLFWYWNLSGRLSDGRTWLDQLLPRSDQWAEAEAPARARALYASGGLAFLQGDMSKARRQLEASLEIWRRLGDERGLGLALIVLGMVELFQDDLAVARAHEEEARALFVAAGDTWGEALACNDLGNVILAQGDPLASRDLFELSVSIWEEVGDPWGLSLSLGRLGCAAQQTGDFELAEQVLTRAHDIRERDGDLWGKAESLRDLGELARRRGRHGEAEQRYQESLRLNLKLGRLQMVADCLVGLGAVAGARGDAMSAAEAFGMADALRAASDVRLSKTARHEYERTVAEARGTAGDATFTSERDAAAQRSVDDILDQVDRAAAAPAGVAASRR